MSYQIVNLLNGRERMASNMRLFRGRDSIQKYYPNCNGTSVSFASLNMPNNILYRSNAIRTAYWVDNLNYGKKPSSLFMYFCMNTQRQREKYLCNMCGGSADRHYKHCPHCGRKMITEKSPLDKFIIRYPAGAYKIKKPLGDIK